jgi:hypothetical protein
MPMIPPTALQPIAINVNFATPDAVSNVLRPLDHKVVRYPPRSASSVLTAANIAEAKAETVLPNCPLAAHADAKIAGQMRTPRSNTAARASPVAGQIGGAPGSTASAIIQPSFARTK